MKVFDSSVLVEYIDICIYVIVISQYKGDIVITQDQGGAEVECNDNDIIRVDGI